MRRYNRDPVQSDRADLALLFEATADCVAILDEHGNVLRLNPAGATAFGASDLADRGVSWLDIWHDDDRACAAEALVRATRSGAARFRARSKGSAERSRRYDTTVRQTTRVDGGDKRLLVIARDVTEQQETEQALERSHKLQQALIEATSEMHWHVDAGTGVTTRRGYLEFTGLPDNPGNMDGWLDSVHADDQAWAKAMADQAERDLRALTIEYRLLHRTGEWRWVEDSAFPLTDADGVVTDWVGIVSDIHVRKCAEQALRKSLEYHRLVVEATGLGTWDVDMRTGEREWSPEMFDLLRLPRDTPPTRELFINAVHPDDRARVDHELRGTGETDDHAQVCTFRLHRSVGEDIWIEARERTFYGPGAVPIRRVGAMQDITARKKAEHEIWLAAHTDALTGVANRALFQSRLDQTVVESASKDGRVGLLLIDLDRFKDINDMLGHDAGDALLRAVAGRLSRLVPQAATVARLGGDEFGVIVPMAVASSLAELAAALIEGLCQPFFYAGRDMDCGASLGWSVFPDQAGQSSQLLKNADLALYAAKSAGRNRAVMFSLHMETELERRLHVLRAAREALAHDAIVPFYQPKICLRSGAVLGFEALMRWTDPSGLRLPGALQEALDNPELSVRLGSRMLEGIVRDTAAWTAGAVPFGHVGLNLSTAEFQGNGLVQRLLAALDTARIAARQLEVEVTERVLLDDGTGGVAATLNALHDAGILIALDDFGTGFASLTHLTKFPVSWVKIDRSFTSNIETDPSAAAIVKAVVNLAHAVNIRVVAEGVETAGQLAFLRQAGCDVAQGFLLAKPMAGSRVPHFLQSWTTATFARLAEPKIPSAAGRGQRERPRRSA